MTVEVMANRGYRFAAWLAFAMAIATALAGVFYFLLPAAQRLGVPGRELLPSFAASPVMLQLETLALAAMGVAGLGLIRPIRRLTGDAGDAMRWLSKLALVGYAVAAVGNTLILGKLPGIANSYVNADASAQTAITTFWRTTLDPWGLWQFGAVGIWLIAAGVLAWRNGALPSVGAYLAIAAGIAHIAVPVVLLVSAQSILAIGAAVAALVIVVFFAWLGLYLWRTQPSALTP
jgi:hypothetical protein